MSCHSDDDRRPGGGPSLVATRFTVGTGTAPLLSPQQWTAPLLLPQQWVALVGDVVTRGADLARADDLAALLQLMDHIVRTSADRHPWFVGRRTLAQAAECLVRAEEIVHHASSVDADLHRRRVVDLVAAADPAFSPELNTELVEIDTSGKLAFPMPAAWADSVQALSQYLREGPEISPLLVEHLRAAARQMQLVTDECEVAEWADRCGGPDGLLYDGIVYSAYHLAAAEHALATARNNNIAHRQDELVELVFPAGTHHGPRPHVFLPLDFPFTAAGDARPARRAISSPGKPEARST